MNDLKVETSSDEGLSFLQGDDRDDVMAAEKPVYEQAGIGAARWRVHEHDVYQVEIRLCRERDGGFSVHVPTLPGVVSEGETEEKAEKHFGEALLAVIESYRKDQEPIPWRRARNPLGPGEIARWIVVHA